MTEDQKVYGVTYRWNQDKTDAVLLTTAEQRVFSVKEIDGSMTTQIWDFPSRAQCMTCHNSNAGWVLGLKSHALNKNLNYPQTGVMDNQLRAWNHINLFSEKVSETAIAELDKSASLDDAEASLELKVRSYLDINCSFCHRPDGVEANFDARLKIPLDKQKIVNAPTTGRNSQIDGTIVLPGDTLNSEMFLRVHKNWEGQMPPVGRNTVDHKFVATLKAWIMSLEERKFENMVVYPNPTRGNIIVDFGSTDLTGTCEIFSISGKLVKTMDIDNKRRIEFMLDGPKGMYILRIKNTNGEKSIQKVVKL